MSKDNIPADSGHLPSFPLDEPPLNLTGESNAPPAPAFTRLGETAVDTIQPVDVQTGQPVPYELTTIGSGNTTGPDHSLDPLTGAERPRSEEPATRIDDPVIAEQVAYSAKNYRTNAANTRRTLAAEDRFKNKLEEIMQDHEFRDTSLWYSIRNILKNSVALERAGYPGEKFNAYPFHNISDSAAVAMTENYKQMDRANRDIEDKLSSPDALTNRMFHSHTPYANSLTENWWQAAAERDDEIAERIEDWARFLLEHPVNETYARQNADFDFSPEGMIDLEDLTNGGGRKRNEEFLGGEPYKEGESYYSFKDIFTNLQEATEALSRYKRSEEDAELLRQATGSLSPSMTLGQLAALNQKIRDRVNQNLKAIIARRFEVLEEVLDGRASRSPENNDAEQPAL